MPVRFDQCVADVSSISPSSEQTAPGALFYFSTKF